MDKNQHDQLLNTISTQCRDFIAETKFPMYRSYDYDVDVKKVRVRTRKRDNSVFNTLFNGGFDKIYGGIRQRSIFTSGEQPGDNGYYVFPINGYQFMYNDTVGNSVSDLEPMFQSIRAKLGENASSVVIEEFLRFSYQTTNINEGVRKGVEIIIYNIPFFYVVRADSIGYAKLIMRLKNEN
jgi:hypothetical protein